MCARVLETMTFDHVPAEWQPSLVSKILELDEQAANHRVDPAAVIGFNVQRLEQLTAHRSDAAYQASLERIELAKAVLSFRALKRELGVIDFGDQITMALSVVEDHLEAVQDYRSRYLTVVLDEYQDTNVAQAAMIAGLFGDGFPVTAVGDPDQNIYAWRGASLFNLLEFQEQFPHRDGSPATKLSLYTNFRSGSRILAAADVVIGALPPAQRPDPDKALVPWPGCGDGQVELARFTDEWTEARWIAERIRELHDSGEEALWRDVAVLCRTSRLFVPLQDALAERGVPAEFVGLVGLLKVPEVVEVLAYARAVADPLASVSLARILLGPRYRIGFKDLARVAAWASHGNRSLRDADRDDIPPFLFAEALEHLGEVATLSDEAGHPLSDEGRLRLEEFRVELDELRVEARRPVAEFLAEVIRRTGLLGELDASLDVDGAAATKRNLAAFLDEVHAFSPLEGELTLQSFLDYVDTVDASEKQEWSPVQPSTQNSVKVMTIHQAKGLEFGSVFVPGFARDLLPNLMVQQNPAERGKSLDFELRGDARILPRFQGNLRQFWLALREQELMEERRTCYVALTRAKRRLVATGAHWYGEGQKPKDPSVFFDELLSWAAESGLATVHDLHAAPDVNPLLGYRSRFVRDWPGPALRQESDELFPQGWRHAAAEAETDSGTLRSAVAGLRAGEQLEFKERASAIETIASHLRERRAEEERSARAATPGSLSVGALIEYARCPKRFYWSVVRPLPRFSGPAARIGTQVHAWIERKSSGQASLLDLDDPPDLTDEELVGEPGRIERLQRTFSESRFATAPPLFAERPFLLYVDGFVVGGRIDAIFGTPEGSWEVVDYKTGRKPPHEDPLSGLQLDLYALACVEVWRKRPEELTLTYFYLASGDVEETRLRVSRALRGVAGERFDPTPSGQCRWCDFLSFCDAGTRYVQSMEE